MKHTLDYNPPETPFDRHMDRWLPTYLVALCVGGLVFLLWAWGVF